MQESNKDTALNDAERQQVSDALEAILATEKFEVAPQMSAFLRYVVEQTALGNRNRIKAFTVAVDALGKPETFDPQNDPVVRVLAGRLRAALTAYNEQHSETDLPVKITMVPGSYVPAFEYAQAASTDTTPTAEKIASHANPDGETDEHVDVVSPVPADTETDNDGVLTTDTVLPATAMTSQNKHNSGSLPGGLLEMVTGRPRVAIAGALLAVLIIGVVQSRPDKAYESGMQAATPAGVASPRAQGSVRSQVPSVFVSAVDNGDALENTINTVVSGVILESKQVRVYCLLDLQQDVRFWPEDYILSIAAMDLPDEKRVNMQLLEARTGRVVHSRELSLSKQASRQMSLEELSRLTEAARQIVSSKGPLLSDLASRDIAQ